MARLQQIAIVTVVVLAFACASFFVSIGEPLWAAVAFGLVASGHAVFLGFEFLLLARLNRAEPADAATKGDLWIAWWREVLAASEVFSWQQPFRSCVEPDHLPIAAPKGAGVILVHGYLCNRGLWNPWLTRLREHGVPFVAVNLEPVFGSIDDYAPIIEQAVRRVEAATATPSLIVAHSMGGLAVRAWLDRYGADARVQHVITIGTPHRGTALARFAFTPNARQMRLDSPWHRALARREPLARYANFTCFYSHCDNIVFPATTAKLPGADNRQLGGVAHVCLARNEAVFRELLRRVGTPESRPQRGRVDAD